MEHSRPKRGRGAAAVEFALVSALLVGLLFGIIEAGWALYTQGTLAGAAREGARYYALNPAAVDVATKATQRVKDSAVGLKGDGITVTFAASDCPMKPPVTKDSLVTVTVKYQHDGLTGVIPSWASFQMSAVGSMRCTG